VRPSARQALGLLLLACLGVALYLAWAWAQGGLGFPLDDAWIHQTYARNLAQTGRWTYTGGQVSAGSTSPLWTLLLVPGHLLGLDPRTWAYALGLACLFLGLACLFGSGWFTFRVGVALGMPGFPTWLLGAVVVTEWHLVWAALSGMETILFVFLALALVAQYLRFAGVGRHAESVTYGVASVEGGGREARGVGDGERHVGSVTYGVASVEGGGREARGVGDGERHAGSVTYGVALAGAGAAAWRGLLLGLLAGLLVLTRPDGILLVGWLALDYLWDLVGRWRRGEPRSAWLPLLVAGVGFLLPLLPYLLTNWLASGTLWPNTFYAKQAEYQELLRALSLPQRLGRLLATPWVGPQVLLLPGLVALAWSWLRRTGSQGPARPALRRLVPLAGWWLTVVGVYALRLPVTYQHGRYLMPIIPAILVLGGVGSWLWLRPSAVNPLVRVASRAWLLGYGVLVVAFLILGARGYSWDTRFIETELVDTARWLRANTPADSLVAVHDIGAIGYLSQRDLLDLAGLVSPEVIPFIRDEEALLDYVVGQGADYLVTFPSWYPRLTQDPRLHPVFRTDAPWAPALGGENMVVYRVMGR